MDSTTVYEAQKQHVCSNFRILYTAFQGICRPEIHQKAQYFLFGDFLYNFSNSDFEKKKKDRPTLPLASSKIFSSSLNMPCSGKNSTKAKLQRKLGTVTFAPSTDITNSDDGSLYTASESKHLSDSSKSSDDENNTLQSIEAMQTLYSIFLPSHLKVGDKGHTVSLTDSVATITSQF